MRLAIALLLLTGCATYQQPIDKALAPDKFTLGSKYKTDGDGFHNPDVNFGFQWDLK